MCRLLWRALPRSRSDSMAQDWPVSPTHHGCSREHIDPLGIVRKKRRLQHSQQTLSISPVTLAGQSIFFASGQSNELLPGPREDTFKENRSW